MLNDLWTRFLAWSGTIVAPDWGGLVALIPLLLLLVVVAFLVVTGAKWAGAGPATRGRGRRPPAGPDGRPMRAPVLAPLAVAVGVFVLAFGLVSGGLWAPAGIVIAAVGLSGWLLERRRGSGSPAGPEATPPGGRPTAPPPARRPRLTPARVVVLGLAAVVVVALAATSRVVPDAPGSTASLPPVPPSAAGPTLPSADAVLTAANITFLEPVLTAPAGRPFTVAFDNQDNVPHNLEIRDAVGGMLFRGDIVTGPKVVVYAVPALPAGQYPFLCTVHPGMTGTLTVK